MSYVNKNNGVAIREMGRLRKWPAGRLLDSAIESGLVEQLITARKKRGLSQAELARKLNLSKTTIHYWEVGVAYPSTMAKFTEWARAVDRKFIVRLEQ